MKFTDGVTVAGTRRRDDGYLVADARVARTGIQIYAGWEVDKPDMPVVRVYRPEDEVFSKDTLASFAHRPVTNDHPAEAVTADNWKQHAVGNTSDEIARDGTFIRVPLMVSDAAAIKDIEAGKRELSSGYSADLDWTAGITPQGETYDAVQRTIRANHVAIVKAGRAGSQVRIGDAASWGAAPILQTTDKETITMSDALRTVVVDGLSVSTTDQGAQAITKLMKDLEASASKLTDAKAGHDKAIAAKDAEMAKKDKEIDDLKKKVLSDADLDKRVHARASLVDSARKVVADMKTEGLSDADIRKAVVKAKLGDEKIADKSDAYIEARFDGLVEDAGEGADTVRDAFRKGQVRSNLSDEQTADAAFDKSVADLNAWRKEA